MPDTNTKIIEEFRANNGHVGGFFADAPMLLLHSTGAKSGAERVTPMMYLPDGSRYLVFASAAGAPTNPDWYHNLKANPQVVVEVGGRTVTAEAVELTGNERDLMYRKQATLFPQFAEYETKTDRVIPVVALVPSE